MEEKELYLLAEKYYGITEKQIKGGSRKLDIIKAKHVLIVAYSIYNPSHSFIKCARFVGLECHATAFKYINEYKNDYPLKKDVDEFLDFVKMNKVKTKMIVINTALFQEEPTDIFTIEDFNTLKLK